MSEEILNLTPEEDDAVEAPASTASVAVEAVAARMPDAAIAPTPPLPGGGRIESPAIDRLLLAAGAPLAEEATTIAPPEPEKAAGGAEASSAVAPKPRARRAKKVATAPATTIAGEAEVEGDADGEPATSTSTSTAVAPGASLSATPNTMTSAASSAVPTPEISPTPTARRRRASTRIVDASGARIATSPATTTTSGATRPAVAVVATPWPAPREMPGVVARAAGRGALAIAGWAYRSRRCREALSLALFAVAVVHASTFARARVEADVRYRVSKASLAATAPPPGLAKEAIEDLASIPLPGRSFSLYRPDAIPTIASAYGALPWVREVRSVEKIYPAIVRFDLVVRRPVAGLEHQDVTYLLDEEGRLLPRRCYEPNDPAELHLPTIVGAKLGRRHRHEGEKLDDLPIRHGLAVALALQAETFAPLRGLPIRIDVSNVNFEVALYRPEVVVTAGGTVIEWGRSEASTGLNLPLEEKIANFSKLIADRPLDRLSLVRLQFDQVEWHERPIAPPATPE